MQVARIQPPLALVSALCIAVVPIAGASGGHTNPVAQVPTPLPTWSISYHLDSYASDVGQALKNNIFGASDDFSQAAKLAGLTVQEIVDIPLQFLGGLVHPGDLESYWGGLPYAARQAVNDALNALAKGTGGLAKSLEALVDVGLLPVAVAFDLVQAALPHSAAAAALPHSAAATPTTRPVTITLAQKRTPTASSNGASAVTLSQAEPHAVGTFKAGSPQPKTGHLATRKS